MALAEVRQCARIFPLVVLVLISSVLVGLCQPHVMSSRTREQSGSQINVSVQALAVKHAVGRGGEESSQKLDSGQGDGFVASWRGTGTRGVVEGEERFIGKGRMVVRRRGRRSLRTSKPYPCSVPPGTCQVADSCCGSACANVAVNPNHCGRCGHICRPDRACCNGKCRRLATDERNCGRCGSRCALGTQCLFGLCGY